MAADDSGTILRYSFYYDWFNRLYKSEENLAQPILFFTLVALVISCLGVFGMAEFITKQRTKEIGIRKALGSTTESIVALLTKDSVKWMMMAFVIACPLAVYAMEKWLANFAFKTEMNMLLF